MSDSRDRYRNDPKPVKNSNKPVVAAVIDHAPVPELAGLYAGDFGAGKMYILFNKLTGSVAEGISMTGGVTRPFAGVMSKNDNTWEITAKEPGDDKTDGVFTIIADPKFPGKIKGSWKPYKADTGIPAKEFVLDKKACTYNESAGMYPESSRRLLKDGDVSNLMKSELEDMRNEIFARHGYYFSKKETRESFENQNWYMPYSTDIKNQLTEIEKKNIALIKKYEKYAAEYGDDFGR